SDQSSPVRQRHTASQPHPHANRRSNETETERDQPERRREAPAPLPLDDRRRVERSRGERVASLPELEVRPALGVVLCRVAVGPLVGTQHRPRREGAGGSRVDQGDGLVRLSAATDQVSVRAGALPRGGYSVAHAPIRLSISARSRVSGAAATARAMMSATSKSMAGVATRLLARFLSTQRTTRTWFALIVMPASCASLETSFGWRSGCWRMKSALVIGISPLVAG